MQFCKYCTISWRSSFYVCPSLQQPDGRIIFICDNFSTADISVVVWYCTSQKIDSRWYCSAQSLLNRVCNAKNKKSCQAVSVFIPVVGAKNCHTVTGEQTRIKIVFSNSLALKYRDFFARYVLT